MSRWTKGRFIPSAGTLNQLVFGFFSMPFFTAEGIWVMFSTNPADLMDSLLCLGCMFIGYRIVLWGADDFDLEKKNWLRAQESPEE